MDTFSSGLVPVRKVGISECIAYRVSFSRLVGVGVGYWTQEFGSLYWHVWRKSLGAIKAFWDRSSWGGVRSGRCNTNADYVKVGLA